MSTSCSGELKRLETNQGVNQAAAHPRHQEEEETDKQPNKRKSKKSTKSTKISSLFPKRGVVWCSTGFRAGTYTIPYFYK